MKVLAGFTAMFIVLSTLGWTVYFHADTDPWGGWFAPLWFGSLGGAVLSLSCVAITRAVSEIASGEVDQRRRNRGVKHVVKPRVDTPPFYLSDCDGCASPTLGTR